jgi:hypothetical protein
MFFISWCLQNAFQITYFLWIWVINCFQQLYFAIMDCLLPFSTHIYPLLNIDVLYMQYSFGLKSCFHANFDLVIAKVALG